MLVGIPFYIFLVNIGWELVHHSWFFALVWCQNWMLPGDLSYAFQARKCPELKLKKKLLYFCSFFFQMAWTLPGVWLGFSKLCLPPNEKAGWWSNVHFSGAYEPGAGIHTGFLLWVKKNWKISSVNLPGVWLGFSKLCLPAMVKPGWISDLYCSGEYEQGARMHSIRISFKL